MAADNTLTSLNTQFKYVQAKSVSLLPENAVLLKIIPELTEAQKEGRLYLVPCQLSHENGVTYGDGSVFALNSSSAAIYDEIEVDAQPIILVTQLSESVVNRMLNSEKSFISESTLRMRVMYDSLARYLEISMLYGKSATGLGTLATAVQTGSTAVCVATITAAQWSAGIWGSHIGGVVEFYYGATQVADTTNVTATVTKVVASTRTITFTCASAALAAAIASAVSGQTVYVLPKGAKANDMLGLDAQITGGTTFFGIDPTTYPLWQGNVYACGSASLTMAKVLAGEAEAVSIGGLNVDTVLMVSAKTFQNLNSDQAALRAYDGSYDSKDAEVGTEGITYHGCSGGKITVMVNNICKEGEAFLVPPKYLSRVGARELGFGKGGNDDAFKEIPGYAGYSLRAGAEFCVLLSRPAMAVKFTGIVNS